MTNIYFNKIIIFSGAVLLLLSCNRESDQKISTTQAETLPENIVEMRSDQISLANIKLGSVEMKSVNNILKSNGIITVAPQNIATVSMPLGGFIRSTTLLPGNQVKKGQLLAVIENQDFIDIQQNYLEARNKFVYAKAEFERHTDLFKDDVYSEKNVQQVTVEYRNTQALMKSLEQKLIMIGIDPLKLNEENISNSVNLTSPISGFLKVVNINIGKYVAPTDILFEIVNNNKLYLELNIFEKDIEKVKPGQEIKFFLNNGNEEHKAVVIQTGKSVDDDKSLKVFASITDISKNILPGMYVNAFIMEDGENAPALPSEAIVSFDDKDYIFVFNKEKEENGQSFSEYEMVEVIKKNSFEGFTEITLPDGLDITKTKVVVKGAYNLLSAKKNAGEMAC
jgi:membrane fusion protein, heavy metal efflux system